mmetsp:Transcript_26606/g.74364  ORF Transcript_26606/g.74364 Transcript_26606/m.74364 type:complete len:103 (+) Transcript_26606:58-366(+)|eukprot:CAMPEP_0119131516 /NCGR_PEP_ID=MMETSP1310-20130426/10432_1 /TAXON_ID=464262 /ORGANISM="Genus nov. species nov., Strain RCC2339" /LENGTH=102 /DNA_ID=CAMNT_0007122095 /DNA_START=58 /DNA_END=366 /DNA_ORIENTATION=+
MLRSGWRFGGLMAARSAGQQVGGAAGGVRTVWFTSEEQSKKLAQTVDGEEGVFADSELVDIVQAGWEENKEHPECYASMMTRTSLKRTVYKEMPASVANTVD